MTLSLPAKAALLIPLVILHPASARTSDQQQAISIEANANRCDSLKSSSTCRYAGNVIIRQGTLIAHAESADVILRKGQVDHVTLVGNRAHQVQIHQQQDDGSAMDAQADKVDYWAQRAIVNLTGNYSVTSAKGTNTGQTMTYNTRTGVIQSGGDGSRVHTVIAPKNTAAEPTEPVQQQPSRPPSEHPVQKDDR